MTDVFRRIAMAAATGFLAAGALTGAALAEERELSVELNAAKAVEEGCRVSFLVANGMDTEIEASVFEIAVIGKDGGVTSLIRLDFGRLPEGKSRIRQFDLSGQACEEVGRVLLNDVTECAGEGLSPDACLDALAVSTRTGIAFGL